LVVVALVSLTGAVHAQTDGAGFCTLFGNDAADEGRLFYVIDPQTGDGTIIGDPGQAVTGMAFHPSTGVLYGSTAVIDVNSPSSSSIDPGHLITINPLNGDGTDIGSFGLAGGGNTLADLAFDPATGVLYGWRAGDSGDLYTVNLQSGAATLVGESGLSDLSGGGLEFVPGIGLVAAIEGTDTQLRIIDKNTGLPIGQIALTGYGDEGEPIAALTWDGRAFLYGVTRKDGNLIRIDPKTGETVIIGEAAGNEEAAIDALAFSACGSPAPAMNWAALMFVSLGLAAVGAWQMRRRRQRLASPA
jgi:hypothetical protein